MQKILAITLKELTLVLRDRTALLLRLVAPLALTLVMNFAFSGLAGGAGLAQINVVIVNGDDGALGQALVDLLQSEALSDLLNPTTATDAGAARAQVNEANVAAAVIIPAGFSEHIISGDETARVEVYGDPGRPISAGVVRGIVERFAQQVAAGTLGAQVTLTQLIQSGRVQPADAATLGPEIGNRVAVESVNRQLVTVNDSVISGGSNNDINFLQTFAPGIAILFLMFSMSASARTLLVEKEIGTLARLRASPTSAGELLAGKVAGILASGVLQMAVLIAATTLMMNITWGDALGVSVLVVGLVLATAAMGLVMATLARTAGQANAIGSAVVMTLAALGGNFVPRQAYPQWMQIISLVGPNAWGLEGFQKLANGGALADVGVEITALLVMTVVFFGVALWGYRRFVK
jgi:ABC-2 type transport system permease protein